jgi:hypothetical protein
MSYHHEPVGRFEEAFEQALAVIDFPVGHRLFRYGSWRLSLVGPWRMPEGLTFQAIAHPHNATGEGLDREIEGIGGSPEAALRDLIGKIAIVGLPSEPVPA